MKRTLSQTVLGAILLVGCSSSETPVKHQPVVVPSAPQVVSPSPVPALSIPTSPKPPTVTSSLSYQVQTYQSQVFGSLRSFGIVLPPGYDRDYRKHYPVIFLLHGGHGDPTSWFKLGNALPVIEALYANQSLPPSIIITPDGNDNRGSSPFWDPEYINGKNGNVLSAIGDELVSVIKSRYRTLPSPRFWAIGGLSSGGWGAVNIGLHYPQTFGTLFSHSGYFKDGKDTENSPIEYVKTLKPETRQAIAVYLDAGEKDGTFLTQSEDFHQVLDQLAIANQFNEFPGGHGIHGAEVGWKFWHRHLADSLTYVGDRFQSAATVSQR